MEINALAIKDFRKKYQITQVKLANLLGVSYRTVQNYENGMSIPTSKARLLRTVFEDYEAKIIGKPKDEKLLKYKDFYALNPKFETISLDEIVRYVVVHDEELMKNEVFQIYIKNKQSEKAIEMLIGEIEKMEARH